MFLQIGCTASAQEPDPLAQYHNRGDVQGLYEIREAARGFVAQENKKNKTNWVVIAPDMRFQVTLCSAPLKVKWLLKSPHTSGPHVSVSCSNTVNPKIEKSWNVPLVVYERGQPK